MIVAGLLLTPAGELDSQVARLLIYEVPPSQVLTRLQNHGQHRVAYEGTGRRRPVICACGCAVGLESPLLRPCTAGIVTLRYSHTGACRAPERGRA
ncbi:hypothetical protein ACIRA2_02455 [Streptomyces griseoviridis]